jgi:hypothetical protein
LGILKATKKASAPAPAPKKLAMTTSRIKPKIREIKVIRLTTNVDLRRNLLRGLAPINPCLTENAYLPVWYRTYLIIPREPRCCTPDPRSRREVRGIAVAIPKPINAERGPGVRNPQGQGVCGASPRRSSFIWNNQTSLLASCATPQTPLSRPRGIIR